MEIVLRILAVIIYYIGALLTPLIKWINAIKQEQIPKAKDDILNLSVSQLIWKLKHGEITSEQLVRSYIKRIKEVNPILNAVIEDRFVNAVEDAQKADQIIAQTENKEELFSNHPLLGIPFTVKESCSVSDLSHVVGSGYRRHIKSIEDGAAINLIRRSGGIPLLVSANPEMCYSWETSTLTHGRCDNPYNTRHTPGGSSGGEAALNASGATVFGIGSDLCGSVRIPSLFCGVFGHKPTGKLVSTDNHFPNVYEEGFDDHLQIGPITRFAGDLPLLLNVIAGSNASKLYKSVDINDIKIYYTSLDWRVTSVPIDDSIKRSIALATKHFVSRGNSVELINLKEFNDLMEITLAQLLTYEPPTVHANPIEPDQKTTTLKELGKHLTGKAIHSVHALVFQGFHDLRILFPESQRRQYIRKREALITKLGTILGKNGVLLFPTLHRPAYLHNTSVFHIPGTVLSGIFNMIGFPTSHIPMGLNKDGLPIGFQAVAAPYADRNCFQVALELENAFGGWKAPV